jgi:cation diffusion facilitator CzcD-associated flavoprotein CzcO
MIGDDPGHEQTRNAMTRHVDVLIIGAGLSGIDVACHLEKENTGRSYAILERRTAVGGTWDLFRYPGIRSDSDMYSFGYGFRPWRGTRMLADGAGIRRYIAETADEYGVTPKIRFGRKVVSASWSGPDNRWTVRVLEEATGAEEIWTSTFLVGATGYYDYDNGHRPSFPGEDVFTGRIVHPQHWPEDLDYRDKKVVVIGSGATAITLVPSMVGEAAHVTMLQRSPTYIASIPGEDPVALGMTKVGSPAGLTYQVGRARNIAVQQASYQLSRRQPKLARQMFLKWVRLAVGPGVDMRHFTPEYAPWDQRLCVVPDGDLFKALRRGHASVVTDTIETFTETGIRVSSGAEIDADIVVTATGLTIQILGGVALEVDGEPVVTRDRVMYKGSLLDGVPNALMVLGYTNASWTLKADLAAEYFCRVLNRMRDKGYTRFVARAQDSDRSEVSVMGGALSSGYIQRGDAVMPRQGTGGPWKVVNSYFRDRSYLRKSPIEDGILTFTDRAGAETARSGGRARGAASRLPLIGTRSA